MLSKSSSVSAGASIDDHVEATTLSKDGVGRRINPILMVLFVLFSSSVLYLITGPFENYTISMQWMMNNSITALAPSPSAELTTAMVPSEAPIHAAIDQLAQNSTSSTLVEELEESEDVRLEKVLKAASMPDNTVILTTLNSAWAAPNTMIDLFLESFKNGDETIQLVDHLIIVALDTESYQRCKSIHKHCFALKTEGVDFSGEKFFMSSGYLKMMWRRIDFLRTVLEKGYNFIFSDSDILWFRNPLPYFYPNGDFQIACDHFSGDPSSTKNYPNGGFNYVKSNNRSIAFYKYWYTSREKYPKLHDQDVLNKIKNDPFIHDTIKLSMKFLNTEHFGGFCEPSKDFNKVCTMHANCCVGLKIKLHDLRVLLEDWKGYKMKSVGKRMSGRYSWSLLSTYCG